MYILYGNRIPSDNEVFRRLVLWKARKIWLMELKSIKRHRELDVQYARPFLTGDAIERPTQLRRIEVREILDKAHPRLISDFADGRRGRIPKVSRFRYRQQLLDDIGETRTSPGRRR